MLSIVFGRRVCKVFVKGLAGNQAEDFSANPLFTLWGRKEKDRALAVHVPSVCAKLYDIDFKHACLI